MEQAVGARLGRPDHPDVKGDVPEAVILQPSLSAEAACLRSSVEQVTWQWGSDALAAMAEELGETGPGTRFEGTQNWWSSFTDTQQNANYPASIMGLEAKNMTETYHCNVPGSFSCDCAVEQRDQVLKASKEEEVLV
ncbi:unnamed protein product [Effrenium voratum]|nr:unnamed protein product [Effrenium voratum]